MEEITIDHLQTIAKNRTDVIITQHTLYRFRAVSYTHLISSAPKCLAISAMYSDAFSFSPVNVINSRCV